MSVSLQWDSAEWLPDAQQTTLSLLLLNRAGQENKMIKLMVQNQTWKTACQLPLYAKSSPWGRLIYCQSKTVA